MNYYMNNGSSNAEENNKGFNIEIKDVYDNLEKRKDGTTRQTISNAIIVLENDPEFKGAIKRNELSCQTDIVKEMDWRRRSKSFTDTDFNNILLRMEKRYGITRDKNVKRADWRAEAVPDFFLQFHFLIAPIPAHQLGQF